jgi:long-chain fatty acid transport protein
LRRRPRSLAVAVRRTLFLAALAGVLSRSGTSGAAGFASARFGGEHGNVTEVNPTALYFNPGAIARSEGVRLYLDGVLAIRSLTWTHAATENDIPDPEGAEGANSGRAELFNLLGAPMFGATFRAGDFAFGAAAYVPFGGRAHWSKNERFAGAAEYPLAADGVQRWHGIEGAVTYLYGTLGVAYRLGPLGIGASANLVSSTVRSKKAKNPTGQGNPDTEHEGRAELEVSGIQGSFGLGALFEAVEDELWLGVSYQAQPGLGPMQLSGTLTVTYDGSSAPYPVTLDQALPDIVRAGARYRPLRTLELRLFGDMTRWSVMQTQCVAVEGYACLVDPTGADAGDGGVLLNLRRKWRDTVGIRAGASHWLSEPLELFAGMGFETAAVPDSTLDPELADSEVISLSLGGRLELPDQWYLGASYTHLQYMTRDNRGESELAEPMLPTRRPDGGGRYQQWIGLLNANVEKAF